MRLISSLLSWNLTAPVRFFLESACKLFAFLFIHKLFENHAVIIVKLLSWISCRFVLILSYGLRLRFWLVTRTRRWLYHRCCMHGVGSAYYLWFWLSLNLCLGSLLRLFGLLLLYFLQPLLLESSKFLFLLCLDDGVAKSFTFVSRFIHCFHVLFARLAFCRLRPTKVEMRQPVISLDSRFTETALLRFLGAGVSMSSKFALHVFEAAVFATNHSMLFTFMHIFVGFGHTLPASSALVILTITPHRMHAELANFN